MDRQTYSLVRLALADIAMDFSARDGLVFATPEKVGLNEKTMKRKFEHQFVLVATFFFAMLLLASCATRARFASSAVVPAAQGEVKLKKDNNNNYRLSIEVENLAEPNRLPQPRNVYVVWADTPSGVQNLGQLKVDKGFLSGKLKASLETVTPYKPSRIFITAEDAAAVTYPGTYTVLNTESF